jgi:DNA-binding transcriptional ArsR family regulator
METFEVRPGELYRREQAALQDEIRREILEQISLDLVSMKHLQEEMDLKEQDLNSHLAMLERALLVEREEESYRLTPRCIAYLDECHGYEWKR